MFTFIALLIVVAIIGVLANLAIFVAAVLQALWAWVSPVRHARPVRPARAVAAPAPPKMEDQRPLWAREELRDIPAAAPLDPWQEKMDRFYDQQRRGAEALRRSLEIEAAQAEARAQHQAQSARDRAFDREWASAQRPTSFHGDKPWWVGPHGTPHRLKAKGRNSA